MSDDKKVVSILGRLKKEKEHSPIPEEILSIMNSILKPDDLAGFCRVIEVLRTIGDTVEIRADIIDLKIKCAQRPTEDLELNGGKIEKQTEVSQTATIDFAFLPEEDTFEAYEEEIDIDEYVERFVPTVRAAIESLMYWQDGTEHEDEEEYEDGEDAED